MNISMSINLIFLALSPFAAILASGIFRKLFARFQNRQGPPIIQPFYDLMKLWGKQRAEAEESKNFAFYFGLIIAFFLIIALYLIFLGIFSFDYDFIAVIYLLISIEAAIVCSAFASKSVLSYLGSMRELSMMIGYELIFAFSIISIIASSGIISISNMDSSLASNPFSIGLMLFAGLAILRITPFDTVNAKTEISAGMPSEYSGRMLMLYLFIEKLKDFMFYLIVSRAIMGWNIFTPFCALALIFFYALINATSARYSFMLGAKNLFIVALIAFINLGVIKL